ncbi:c-type cytochrome [Parasphingopyxis marina]|uniref:c-type cytochrome n=1 Tax=Parasphingopyxis marina TaxID=2761622 RepID=UPI002E2DA7B6|nr:cytochrome c family protein [Parasphingopyxis marina]
MKTPNRIVIAAFTLSALSACGSGDSGNDETTVTETSGGPPETAPEGGEEAGSAAAGERLFAQCMACHSVEPGRNGLGPSLHGVFGRAAGADASFSYSPAMRDSGITWTAEELDRFIERPMQTIPGTRMSFIGVRDPQGRADLIAYLETLQ